MEEKKFYSLAENGTELQVLTSPPEAALEWEISPEHRTVTEVTRDHHSESPAAPWIVVRKLPKEELLNVLKLSRL